MRYALSALAIVVIAAGSPAVAQGFSVPGLGGSGAGQGLDALQGAFAQQTPEQRRAFCGRVGQAALRCGTIDVAMLSACLVRTMPAQDSARVARVANATRGNVGGLIQECGITLGR